MIGIVVGHQQRLAQHGLARAMRNWAEEIAFWIAQDLAQLIEVGENLLHAVLPRVVVGRSILRRPISLGELWRLVVWIHDESHDIPLHYADMFQQLPRRVRRALRFSARHLSREIFNRAAPIYVRLCLGQNINEVLTKGIELMHGLPSFGPRHLFSVLAIPCNPCASRHKLVEPLLRLYPRR